MMKKKLIYLAILLFFMQCLLLCNNSFAVGQGSLDKKFQIPSEYGIVKESFTAEPGMENSRKTIICIQDAHCNYEAQKNMAKILEELIKKHDLKLIMVEGGSGDVGLSFLREYADKEGREKIADSYLRQGKISGEEYLDIVSEYDFDLYGIEDDDLYDAHMDSFFRMDSIKNETLRYLESLFYVTEELKPCLYSYELRKFEDKKKSYGDKEISLVEYCRYLRSMLIRKDLDIENYTHLLAFTDVARLEKIIDFEQAEEERNKFIKDLARLLDDEGVEELVDKTKEFKAGGTEAQDYYAFLQNEAEGKINIKENYSQLGPYMQYVNASAVVDAKDLLEEVDSAENKIRQACLSGDDDRQLNDISKGIDIIRGLVNLELTPEDYNYFQANQKNFSTDSWKEFLGEKSIKYGLSIYPSDSHIIKDNLDEMQKFYQLGINREKAFIRNIVDKMDVNRAKVAVLIAGGFHTPGVTQALKDKGYSYVVVTPVVTKESDSSIYFSVLKEGRR